MNPNNPNKLSWDNLQDILEDEDDRFQELCQQSVPSDFYFCVGSDEDMGTYVIITPRVYFDTEDCLLDMEMDISHILPGDLEESGDSTWVMVGDVPADHIREDLTSRGFVESQRMKDWLFSRSV